MYDVCANMMCSIAIMATVAQLAITLSPQMAERHGWTAVADLCDQLIAQRAEAKASVELMCDTNPFADVAVDSEVRYWRIVALEENGRKKKGGNMGERYMRRKRF